MDFLKDWKVKTNIKFFKFFFSMFIFFFIFLASRPKVKTQKVIDEDEDNFMDIKTDDNFQEDEVIAPEITENNQIEDVQQTGKFLIWTNWVIEF